MQTGVSKREMTLEDSLLIELLSIGTAITERCSTLTESPLQSDKQPFLSSHNARNIIVN